MLLNTLKVFCFIFSVYLLLLSWQPCQDMVEMGLFALEKTTVAQIGTKSDFVPTPIDECSPLCICSCCQTSFTDNRVSFNITAQTIVYIKETPINSYQSDYSQNRLNSIWQPPKFNFTA